MTPDVCPLCGRANLHPTEHHLVPRCRGGKATQTLCRDCHTAIHAHLSNKQLESEFNTVDALLAYPPLRKCLDFIAKQDPSRRFKTLRNNSQKRRGRNG